MDLLRPHVLVVLLATTIAMAAPACLNVDVGAAEGGEKTCFQHDEELMVCGWDGTHDEAYCTRTAAGNLVCARSAAGGKCSEGEVPPETELSAEQRAEKAELEAADAGEGEEVGDLEAAGDPDNEL